MVQLGGRPGFALDSALSLIGISLVGGSAAAYSVLVGRLLGSAALGHAGLALACGLGAAQLVTAGVGPATTRFVAVRRGRDDQGGAWRALYVGVATTGGLAALMAVAATFVLGAGAAQRLGLPESEIAPVAWLIVLQALYVVLKAALYGLSRIGAYAVAEVAAAVTFFAFLVALLAEGERTLVSPFLAGNLVFVCLAGTVVWRSRMALRPDSESEASASLEADVTMPRYATIATIGSVAVIARLHLAVLATGLMWPASEVGQLQAALALAPVVLLAPRALELALFPTVARLYGARDRCAFRRLTARAQSALAAILTITAGGLVLAGPELMALLYGEGYTSGHTVLAAVAIDAWALGLAVPAVCALSGANSIAVPNAAGVVALGLNVVVWWLLVPANGALGAAAGLVVGSLAILLITAASARARYGVSVGPAVAVLVRTGALLLLTLALARGLAWSGFLAAAVFVASAVAVEGRRLRGELVAGGWTGAT